VGVRPEHFEDAALVDGKLAEGLTFSAVVDVLESLGADKDAYFRLQGTRATARELEELAADAGTGDAPGGADQVVARPDNGAHLTL
jgi:multiple sugar transport system ATP-binding protein